MTQNYYDILGIPRNAGVGDIQKAWQKLTLKYHPDINKETDAVEKMSMINKIKEILLDPNERKKYDSTLPPLSKQEGNIDMKEFYDSLLKNLGIDRKKDNLKGNYFLIPENDYGLLYALKEAYGARGDGEWKVSRSENDKRENLPKELYKVIKEKGEVKVSRSIADWREIKDRNEDIIITHGVYCTKRQVSWDTLVGEEYLFGENRYSIEDFPKFPTQLGSYIKSMKSLAQKIAFEKGEIDVAEELNIIKRYAESDFSNIKIEGDVLSDNDLNKEFAPKVFFENFYNKLNASADNVVRVEKPQSKEGSYYNSGIGGFRA